MGSEQHTDLSWARVGNTVAWLHHGVARIDEVKTVADNSFLIVRGLDWPGEPGWIPVVGVDSHLRQLKSVATCDHWLKQLRSAPTSRSPEDGGDRRDRHRLTIEHGTANQLVAALAEAYAEPQPPDDDDLDLIERLERLVVAEIATVLGQDFKKLRAELRQRPRFEDDVPQRAAPIETNEGETLAVGFDQFATFTVEQELHITDTAELSLRVPALAGTWHAVRFEIDQPDDHYEELLGWIAVADRHRDELPLPAAARQLLGTTDGYAGRLAVLDGSALDDPIVAEELRSFASHQLGRQGAATFWGSPTEVHGWMNGDRLIAVSVTMACEEEE